MRSYDFGRVGDVIFGERTTTDILLLLCGSMKQQQGDHEDHEVDEIPRSVGFAGKSHFRNREIRVDLLACEAGESIQPGAAAPGRPNVIFGSP